MAEAKDFAFDKAGTAKDYMVNTAAATDEFNKQYGGDADHDPSSKGGNRELRSEHTSYMFMVEFIVYTNRIIKVLPPKTAEEVVARERERKRTTFLMALPEDNLAKFHKMVDPKEMWEAIKSRFAGNDESKKMHKYLLKQQFEGFSVSTLEGLHKWYDMFQTLLSQLEIHDAGISHTDANQKFLRSLPSSWSQMTLIMRTKPGLDTLSLDDLYNNLRVFERDVKGTNASSSNTQNVAFVSTENTSSANDVSTAYSVSSPSISKPQKEGFSSYTDEVIHSFFANQSGAPQLDYDDREQINDDDMEEMNLKWQVVMISIRIKKFYKRTGKKDCRAKGTKTVEEEMLEDIDWSGHVEEDARNYAIMAYSSSNSGSDNEVEAQLLCHQQNQLAYEQKIRFMKIDLDDKTDVLAYHKKLLAEALNEKEDLKTKFENWQNSSKNLSKLLNTQISVNDKFGLGYGDYRYVSILSYENEVLHSVFMSKATDLEDTHVNDRFADEMHAVPPSLTGNYLPSEPDVEIDYSKFTYGPKQTSADESDSKPSEYAFCESDSSVETSTSMLELIKNASKPPLTESSSEHDTSQDLRVNLEGICGSGGDQTVNDAQAKEIFTLKARIKKLEKRCKPSISHHRAWLRSVSLLSKKKKLSKRKSVSKQERKNAKSGLTKDDSANLDAELDEDIEYMDTEEAVNKGRQELSTAGSTTTLTTTTIFDDEEMTLADTLINLKDDKAKEKGKGVLEEPESAKKMTKSDFDAAQIARDEEIARQLEVELQAYVERERHREEQASMNYIANLYDEVQERIDADHELAVRWTHEEQEKFTHSHVEQVFLNELEKLKRQKKEANDAAESLRKEATYDIQNASTSSTNLINTASTPLSTIGSSRAFNDCKLSYPNPSKYALPDDPLMPHLEDIYVSPSEGIFTDSSYDDEGVVTNFNNLETTMSVSPTPTTRIHTIHPKTQIIGDPKSDVQTRSKVNKNSKARALFQIQKVWILVDFPFGKKAIRTKWVYKNKKDERGVVVRYKARLVAQRHRQEEGIDYDEVFAPMARIEAIRIFLAFASYMGFIVYQMDVKSAFLYVTIDKEVYVSQPPGFVDLKFPNKKSWCNEFEELMKNRFQMISNSPSFLDYSVKTTSTPIKTQKPLVKDEEAVDVDVHLYSKELASPKQTALGKDISNPLIVDSLLKTIWLSMHQVIAMKHWLFQSKRLLVSKVTKKLLCNASTKTEVICPIDFEIGPMQISKNRVSKVFEKLPCNAMATSDVMYPIDFGISPMRLLLTRFSATIEVMCQIDFGIGPNLEGHAYAKRLSDDEYRLVEDLTWIVRPREILSTLKDRNENNLSTLSTIYDAQHKIRKIENAGKTPMQVLMSLLCINLIMEYLVKISKKARILELKRRRLKITVLTSNTPYPLKKIRRDGNCGFRSVALGLGLSEDQWPQVRSDLVRELTAHRERYKYVFGSLGCENIYKTVKTAEEWMLMPNTCLVIAGVQRGSNMLGR
nr:hypothetical protein [Tanacetum cinerariifolium]